MPIGHERTKEQLYREAKRLGVKGALEDEQGSAQGCSHETRPLSRVRSVSDKRPLNPGACLFEAVAPSVLRDRSGTVAQARFPALGDQGVRSPAMGIWRRDGTSSLQTDRLV